MSARARADVERAIREIGGEQLARPVGSQVIGLTPSDLHRGHHDELFISSLQEVLVGAETAAEKHGSIVYTWARSALLVEHAGNAFFGAVDGVLMVGGVVDISILDAIQTRGLPVAMAGGHVPGRNIPSVGADAIGGAIAVVEHLLALGHRRIALVNGPPTTYTSTEKRAGFLAALVRAGIQPAFEYMVGEYPGMDFGEQAGFLETTRLLELPQPPTAIFYASDRLAIGGKEACTGRGLAVPDDISIVGFDDSPAARTAVPALTTVATRRADWGAVATERLLDLLDGQPPASERILLPVELVIRASTGSPRRT